MHGNPAIVKVSKKRGREMKIRQMIKKGWRRLPVRLLTVIVLTVLPINLISIVVSGMVFFNSTEQIRDSYQRELDGGLTYFSNRLDDMDHYYDNFVTQYLEALTLGMEEETDRMVCYEMLDRLKQTYEYADFEGFFYLYDRNSRQLYLKYNSSRYTVKEVEAIKKKLTKMEEIKESKKDWGVEHLGHYYFVGRTNKYTNYQIGLYIDIEQVLSDSVGKFASDGVAIYIHQSEDKVLKFENGSLSLLENESWDEIFRTRLWEKNVYWSVGNGRNEIGVYIPTNKYFGGTQILYICILLLAIAGIALIAVLWKMLERRVVFPLQKLDTGMKEIEQEHLKFRIENTDKNETSDFQYLYTAFNHMAQEVEESKEKDKKMYQTELDNLKLQVNPHMLLNSFNMIYSMAQTKNYEYIQKYTLLLVEYFRYVLRENSSLVPLKKEMNFVENYIEIQKIRFPNTFSYVYRIDEELLDAYVPPLLIQNFVENSMKYGLIPGKNIEILINIRKKEERMVISVTDTGRGMTEEVLSRVSKGEIYYDRMGKKHIGIWNSRRRMEVFFGDDTTFSIVSWPEEGTQVWIEIPALYEMGEQQDGK